MGVKLVSSSGGSVELVAPTTASNFTHTVPAQTGTVLLKESTSGMSVPAFSAYATSSQAVTASTFTKINLTAESFDTASCYDTTNSRFTPNVAGYYQVNGSARLNTTGTTNSMIVVLYKNGSPVTRGSEVGASNASVMVSGGWVVYLNGSTDYIELYCYIGAAIATCNYGDNSSTSSFSASLVRAA